MQYEILPLTGQTTSQQVLRYLNIHLLLHSKPSGDNMASEGLRYTPPTGISTSGMSLKFVPELSPVQ